MLAAANFRQLRTRQALLLIDQLGPVLVKTRPVFTVRARWKTLQAGQEQVRAVATAARGSHPTEPAQPVSATAAGVVLPATGAAAQ